MKIKNYAFLILMLVGIVGCGKVWTSLTYPNQGSSNLSGVIELFSLWNFVDGNPPTIATDLNTSGLSGLFNQDNRTDGNGMVSNNGHLYATWTETNYTGETYVRVDEFTGTNTAPAWTFKDLGATGLNLVATHQAAGVSMVSCNNNMYVAWGESLANYVSGANPQDCVNTGTCQIHVKVYNNNDGAPGWTQIDPAGGLNKVAAHNAVYPALYCSTSGNLYIAFSETNAGGVQQMRVEEYSGAGTVWNFIDGGGANGMNYDVTENAYLDNSNNSFVDMGGNLYLTFTELDGALNTRVAAYNGATWTFIEQNPASSTGMNLWGQFTAAQSGTLQVYNNKLYTFWGDGNGSGSNSVRAAVFNGNIASPSWTLVDNGGTILAPANCSALAYACSNNDTFTGGLTSIVFNGGLYLAWTEFDVSQGLYHNHVAAYNGNDAAPEWTYVDYGTEEGIFFSDGSNHDAANPYFAIYNNLLYMTFNQNNAVRVVYGGQ